MTSRSCQYVSVAFLIVALALAGPAWSQVPVAEPEQVDPVQTKIDDLMKQYRLIIEEHKSKLAELEAEVNKLNAQRQLMEAKAQHDGAEAQIELSSLNLKRSLWEAKANANVQNLEAKAELANLELQKQLHEARS